MGHSGGTRHLFQRAPGAFPRGASAPMGPILSLHGSAHVRTCGAAARQGLAPHAGHKAGPSPFPPGTAPGSEDFAPQEHGPGPKTRPEHRGARSSPGSRRKAGAARGGGVPGPGPR